jgi:hypothetical protein
VRRAIAAFVFLSFWARRQAFAQEENDIKKKAAMTRRTPKENEKEGESGDGSPRPIRGLIIPDTR